MSANWAFTIAIVVVGLFFTVILTSLPERIQRWWETDSNGETPKE